MSGELTGKVAIVTGAGRGLGRTIAAALAERGAHVVVAARSTAELDSFVSEQAAAGREALPCPTDITDEHAVQRLVDATLQRFDHLDILVNNSGVISSQPLLDQPPLEWDRVLNTNLRGVYLTTRAAGRHMVTQRAGKIINIASNFALKGVANHTAYSASKAAVVAFTRSLAIEWAPHNVQVNAIAPGYFSTPLNAEFRAKQEAMDRLLRAIPAHRMGEPKEIVPWLLLLAGTASDFMTGETIVLDGGQSVR